MRNTFPPAGCDIIVVALLMCFVFDRFGFGFLKKASGQRVCLWQEDSRPRKALGKEMNLEGEK